MRAFKTEICLSQKQIEKLVNTIGVCRFLYNSFISFNKDYYEKEGGFYSGFEYDKYVNKIISLEKPWIKKVSSKARKKAIMNAEKAFKNFFVGKSKFPKFKKKNKQDVKAYFPKNNKTDLLVERHRIKVPTLGWVILKEKGYIPTTSAVTSCTVEQKGTKFFISVLVKEDNNIAKQLNEGDGIGIDLGLKEFAVLSDGRIFKNINKRRRIKRIETKLKREQRSLSRKYEYYKKIKNNKIETTDNQRKNLNKNIKRVQMIQLRLTNIRNAYQNFVIREVVKTKPAHITIEDLNVRGMMKNRNLSRAIANQKFYQFKLILLNKCRNLGIELRQVDRFYPSSKLCSKCQNKKVKLSLSERVYNCDYCGHSMDRDKNAAINLKQVEKYTVLT